LDSLTSGCYLVLFSTAALFMSGVVIQKRTLEEIRVGIKTPKPPPPKTYLPDRFRQSTTELKDGSVVIVDDDKTSTPLHKKTRVEVRRTEEETTPRNEPAKAAESPLQRDQSTPVKEEEKVVLRTEMERNIQEQLEANMEHPDPRVTDGRPLTRAERRRLIKEEIQRLSHVEGPAYQRRLY
jgi:hypothetical protein